ncbi:MAG: hypothetical protein K0U59_09585 [Gammaproteobacteria bacterium]|nr:hypothetical protein [Gammaproteobacteria bacterium]
MTKLFNQIGIALTILLLSACGWHLRSAVQNFPPNTRLFVVAENPRSAIAENLSILLQSSSLPLADSAAEANYVLLIHKENNTKRIVSVDAKGRASEYELVTSAVYSVRDQSGHTLLDHAKTDIYRTLQWYDDEVVSKGEEERLLRDEMRRELIARIIDRLQYVSVPATKKAQ